MSQYGDGDVCDISRARWVTARKPHKCDACDEPILPGHRYHKTFWVFDGELSEVKRCARCETIFVHLSDRIDRGGDYEEFCDPELNCGHDYLQRWDEEPPAEIAALAFWLPSDGAPK